MDTEDIRDFLVMNLELLVIGWDECLTEKIQDVAEEMLPYAAHQYIEVMYAMLLIDFSDRFRIDHETVIEAVSKEDFAQLLFLEGFV